MVLGAVLVVTLGGLACFELKRHAQKVSAQKMKDFVISPGGQLTRDSMQFLEGLWSGGELPGVSPSDHGYMFPDDMRTNVEKFPVTRTIHLAKNGDPSRYHYTVRETSSFEQWQLVRAWQTDANGKTVVEFAANQKSASK